MTSPSAPPVVELCWIALCRFRLEQLAFHRRPPVLGNRRQRAARHFQTFRQKDTYQSFLMDPRIDERVEVMRQQKLVIAGASKAKTST